MELRHFFKNSEKGQLKLHLGCGSRILDGWINIDIVKSDLRVAKLRLPEGLRKFPDQSVQFIYASHFLEHLDYPQKAFQFLKQCYRILVPKGIMRIVVPDIELLINKYFQDDKEFFKNQKRWHPSYCTTKLEHFMYALQQDGEHKYGYDYQTLKKVSELVGFNEAIKSEYGKDEIDKLAIDSDLGKVSLFVDLIKSNS